MTTIDCAAFDQEVADLALGFSPEPTRSALLAHAADCVRCAAELHELGRTVDALVELAPEVEPPVGFESRAVAALRPAGVTAAQPAANRRRAWLAVAAVALVLAGLVAGSFLAPDGPATEVRDPSALVRLADDGHVLGRVELASSPSPRVIVTIDDDGWRGTWVCELQRPDGSWVPVGRWTAGEAPTGAWSARVDRSMLDATAMRITADNGYVVASSDRLD